MSDPTLDVTPIYGWGWVIAGEPRFEVPEPFTLMLEESGPPRWTGTVVSADHEFSGCRAVMSQRHTEWDGYLNIRIDPTTGQPSSGFGSINETMNQDGV